jgi:hypothetical protein
MALIRSEVAAGSAGPRQVKRDAPELLEDVLAECAGRRQVACDATTADQGFE